MKKFILRSTFILIIIGIIIFSKNSNSPQLNSIYSSISKTFNIENINLDSIYSYISNKINPSSLESSVSTKIPNSSTSEFIPAFSSSDKNLETFQNYGN